MEENSSYRCTLISMVKAHLDSHVKASHLGKKNSNETSLKCILVNEANRGAMK